MTTESVSVLTYGDENRMGDAETVGACDSGLVALQARVSLPEQREEFDPPFLFFGLFPLLDVENCSCPRVFPEKRRDSRWTALGADEVFNGTGK